MLEKSFTKEEWTEALKGLQDSYTLFVPMKEGDFHFFRVFDGTKSPDFSCQNTRLSPKGLVYPQSERMFEYTLDEREPDANIYKEVGKDYSPRAIVGIRPCDAQAFSLVRRNFDNPEYRDPWWVKGYEATTLVGLGCNEPCSTCFCTSVGGGPFSEKHLDVILCGLGDHFAARAMTDKGEALLRKAEGGAPLRDDQKRGMEEMLKSNKESEAGNKLKAGFLANISHEIRTPLNSVVGFANLLLDDDLSREAKEEYIEHINYNSEKLLQIIGDIIDLSRLSSSQIAITYEEVSITELVNEVVNDARVIIKRTDKPIILDVKNNTGGSGDLVFTDRIWLKRVLIHLMDNAIKFTLDGSIELSCSVDNDNIIFTVSDTGIGINQENLSRIFEEFRQEVDGHHRPFEGLGVGLTLAKEVVERMGGKISVKSEKGVGSEFSFEIPYRPAGTTARSRQVAENVMSLTVDWRKKRCLLVDDNKDVLIYLNRILVDTGISILTARSGIEAIDIIKSNDGIDVVILDMQMPEMNGIETTREIKKIRSNLPIIAQTAYVFENDTDIILEAGCDACLIKPIRRDHLITVMSSFVKSN